MINRSDSSDGLRKRLAAGDVIHGGWMQISHPAVAQILAAAGMDWVALDAEHGVFDWHDVQRCCTAISVAGSVPVVRVPSCNYYDIKRYMDAGALGIILPMTERVEQVEEMLRGALYPPEGERGVGFASSNGYGATLVEDVKNRNDDILICLQIEHHRAIANLDTLLAIERVDAAFLGPYDLSASMGMAGQFDDPRFTEVLEHFLATCRDSGVAAGIHVISPDRDQMVQRQDQGYQMIGCSLDVTMLQAGVAAMLGHEV